MITSILDDDWYNLTQSAFAFMKHPTVEVEHTFFDRGHTVYPEGFARRLMQEEIPALAGLQASEKEVAFVREKGYYLPEQWLSCFLPYFRRNAQEVEMWQNEEGRLFGKIKGIWNRTVLWETPLLSAISQRYYEMEDIKPEDGWERELRLEAEAYRTWKAFILEFGARRRDSLTSQRKALEILLKEAGYTLYKEDGVLLGTSNPMLAMEFGINPQGTQSHALYMLMSALYGYRMATFMGLKEWSEVFQGSLGTALSDTFTTPVFWHYFDSYYAHLFDGYRQDSGDPIDSLRQGYENYPKVHVNPATKIFTASDNLSPEPIFEILEANLSFAKTFNRGRPMMMTFGIGTHNTNHVPKPLRLNIVWKLTRVKVGSLWVDVCKLSDDSGKVSGDSRAVDAACYELGIPR
ncbi:MAG: hypothetical protein Q7S03_01160 [bacterium]|nr:hypothetical protein [bacterium]